MVYALGDEIGRPAKTFESLIAELPDPPLKRWKAPRTSDELNSRLEEAEERVDRLQEKVDDAETDSAIERAEERLETAQEYHDELERVRDEWAEIEPSSPVAPTPAQVSEEYAALASRGWTGTSDDELVTLKTNLQGTVDQGFLSKKEQRQNLSQIVAIDDEIARRSAAIADAVPSTPTAEEPTGIIEGQVPTSETAPSAAVVEATAPAPDPITAQYGNFTSTFSPRTGLPKETQALVSEINSYIDQGITPIPKALRDRMRADPIIGKEGQKWVLPSSTKPKYVQDREVIEGHKDWTDPSDITVSARTESGELEEIPGFMDMKVGERRKLVKTRAQEYETHLETLPKSAAPPTQLPEPQTVDEIPAVMEERSVQAAHAVNDPMPAELDPPTLIEPEAPDSAYREFREKTDTQPGDPITNERAELQQMEEPEKVIEGARMVSGEQEAERVANLLTAEVIPDTPPPPVPPDPSPQVAGGGRGDGTGTGNIVDGLDGGGKKKRKPREDKYRFGAPPIHGRVAVGGYEFPALPDVDQAFAAMRHENRWQHIADKLSARFPAVVRVINAAGTLATAPVQAQGVIAVEVLRERMNNGLMPIFTQLDRIGTEDAVFGVKDARGMVSARTKTGDDVQVMVGQIAENPSRYVLNPLQDQWLKVAQEITETPRRILEAHGQKVHEYEHESEFFVGRVIVGRYDAAGEVVELGYVPMSDKRGLAGRATTVKARTFDSIEDALEAGYVPEASYTRSLMLRARSAGREAVNIRIGHWLAQHLKRAKQGQVPGLNVAKGGNQPRQAGQHELDLLVNAPKIGVKRRMYRLEGPQAERLTQFAQDIAHEGELRRADIGTQTLAKVGAYQRFLILTADLSVLAIQGLFAWAGRPVAGTGPFIDAARSGLRALRDPEAVHQVRATLVDEFAQRGGFEKHPNLIIDYGGPSEFTEAAGGLSGTVEGVSRRVEAMQPGTARDAANFGLAPLRGTGKAMDRFALMFDHVRDVFALSLAEITETAAKNMPDGPQKQAFINAQDSMTNMMLGRLRTARLGITGRQRQVEAGWFLLAPQYYRATFGMLAMAMEGGIRGREARKLLAKAVGTMALLVGGANYASSRIRGDNDEQALGQVMRSLNPSSGEFGSVRVDLGGETKFRVGLGGMPRALASLLMEMVVGEEAFTGDQAPFRGGGPDISLNLGERARTAMRFGEARPAPVLGMLTDVLSGEDFIGQNTELTSGQGLLRLITNNTLPIFLQAAVDDWDTKHFTRYLLKTGAGILGLNTRDLGAQDIREWGARELYPSASYNNLDSWEKKYIQARVAPQLQHLYEQRAQAQAEGMSSTDASLMRFEYTTEREQALLNVALAPGDLASKYFSWIRADEYDRGKQDAVSDMYDLIFGERPPNVPKDDLEKAFALRQEIFNLVDEDQKTRALAAFDQLYPLTSEVGQYVRRQIYQRRVPLVLLQALGNYSRTKGVIYSAHARAAKLYQKVNEEVGPEAAQQAFNAYLIWFFMLQETQDMVTQVKQAS